MPAAPPPPPGGDPARRAGRRWLRPSALPLVLLLLALATLFLFGGDRAYFYRTGLHDWSSGKALNLAENLSLRHNLLIFFYHSQDADGRRYYPAEARFPRRSLYNRFPPGGFALVKLTTLPFAADAFRAKIYAARLLMLLLFSAAAILAYYALARLTGSRWDALTATLLAFSAYYLLFHADMIFNEFIIDLFAVMLVFHGMVLFTQGGRFWPLLVKSCAALLLGWHVYAFLLPFIAFGVIAALLNQRRAVVASPPATLLAQLKGCAAALIRSRYPLLGLVTLLFGSAILAYNFSNEYFALDGQVPLLELPSLNSALKRTSIHPSLNTVSSLNLVWGEFLLGELHRVGQLTLPYAVNPFSIKHTFVNLTVSDYPVIALGALTIAGCVAGLAGLAGRSRIRRRPGMLPLLATLAVAGFCWTIPLRQNVAYSHFEGIFYIGIPLTAGALALFYLRRWCRVRLAPWLALVALALFVASASALAGVGQPRAELAVEAELMDDYAAIREQVDDGTAIYLPWFTEPYNPHVGHVQYFFLTGKAINNRYSTGDYLMLPLRADTPALLTPDNRHIFLYDLSPDELYRAQLRGTPIIAADWQVYLRDGRLTYISPECAHQNERFYLHFVPQDPADLDASRQDYGYDNKDFLFHANGVILHDVACIIARPLPDYAISAIHTGQYGEQGRIWGAEYRLPAP